ncbi:MAG: sulfatase [Phycisphaerae bacterium]|nr:sulfatase [Phycisphaerae bacterium]
MTRLTTLTLLAAAAFAIALVTPTATADDRPNIVFIMSDDHGWQAIGAYGSTINETPNIDRIAHEGMRMDRYYVGNAICAPSRATMLTGLHTHANGMMDNRRAFDGSQRNVAKMLRAEGYQTAMIGKWHLESEPTGFDMYDRLVGQGPYYNPVLRAGGEGIDGYEDVEHIGYTTDIVTDRAIDWIEDERDPEKPFLLLVHHKAPHRDWQPAPRHLHLYDDDEIPEPTTLFDDWSGKGSAATMQEMMIARDLTKRDLKLVPPNGLTKGQFEAWTAAYAPKNEAFEAMKLEGDDLVRWKYQRYAKDYLRSVAAVDEGVGRLLDTLDHQSLTDNTIVIYTSDQGWYLGEHGWFDKRWMYEESFRTPFLVRWPRVIPAGTTSDALTQNIDIAPTMLAAAGEAVPADMHGVSMLPVLEGTTPDDWRDSLYYRYYEYPGWHSVRRHEGVTTERYKLIHFYRLDEWEFYDLEQDPDETRNAIDDPAYEVEIADLKRELARLKTRYQVPPGEHYEAPTNGRRD